jgi:hypothetical protein
MSAINIIPNNIPKTNSGLKFKGYFNAFSISTAIIYTSGSKYSITVEPASRASLATVNNCHRFD